MCTNPLKGFKYGTTAKGKDNYVIRSYAVDHIEINSRGNLVNVYDHTGSLANRSIRDFVEIPCGKCLECRLDYSRQWANRCMLESKQYDDNCFITLTYNDDHIPTREYATEYWLNGEVKEYGISNTLIKRDFQLFMKRLRKAYPDIRIRYFACGEYGTTTKRPHYHAILFNFKPDDLIPIGINKLGQAYYRSPSLEKLWPNGFNVVADCSWNTCAYVARYVAKKIDIGNDKIYSYLNVDPEFILMSRRPGIGADWYDANKKCYSTFFKNYVSTADGPITITSNKYFDKLLDREDPERLLELKQVRKEFAEDKKKIELGATSLPYRKYLKTKDLNLKKKTKSLQRKEI